MEFLKLTRKRSAFSLLQEIESLSMLQGSDDVGIDSFRWNRLQLCIDSIKQYLYKKLGLGGLYV